MQSIPRLTPRRGSTPKPVELTASWDAEAGKACLAWTASDNKHLERYSVRMCGGDKYLSRHELVVATVPREQTTLTTDAGLVPGTATWYRVYVVTDTGNEKGSKAVQVAPPAG